MVEDDDGDDDGNDGGAQLQGFPMNHWSPSL